MRTSYSTAFDVLMRDGFCMSQTPQRAPHTGEDNQDLTMKVCQEGIAIVETKRMHAAAESGERDDEEQSLDTTMTPELARAAQSEEIIGERVVGLAGFLKQMMRELPAMPALVTICRSVRDG
jgi:hypothetical protein